jgi:uncharacterized lipoprotein
MRDFAAAAVLVANTAACSSLSNSVEKVNDVIAFQTADMLWLHESVHGLKAQRLVGVLAIKLVNADIRAANL